MLRWQTATDATEFSETPAPKTAVLLPYGPLGKSPRDGSQNEPARTLFGPLPQHIQDARDTVSIKVVSPAGNFTWEGINLLLEDL